MTGATTQQYAGRLAAAQTDNDSNVETQYDSERRQRVGRQFDVLELMAHEMIVWGWTAKRQNATAGVMQSSQPE